MCGCAAKVFRTTSSRKRKTVRIQYECSEFYHWYYISFAEVVHTIVQHMIQLHLVPQDASQNLIATLQYDDNTRFSPSDSIISWLSSTVRIVFSIARRAVYQYKILWIWFAICSHSIFLSSFTQWPLHYRDLFLSMIRCFSYILGWLVARAVMC